MWNPAVPHLRRCADRKSTRLNSSHSQISYAVFCLKKKNEALDDALSDYLKNGGNLDRLEDTTDRLAKQIADHAERIRVFFFYGHVADLNLHSFPTRRSSD